MIYKRPVFSLFNEQKQEIESTGAGPIREAMRSGKLLASGEAGYYDIQKQSHEVERVNSTGDITKPTGQGIDYHYPNPPEIAPSWSEFLINSNYWGLVQDTGQLGYYQSGIFIDHNDDSFHLTQECIDYYYKSDKYEFLCPASAHSGIFNFNEVSGKFSNGYDTQKNPYECWPKPLEFSISKPLFLSREMIMIHRGTGVPGTTGNAVVIPYLGDFEKLKTKPTLKFYEDPNKEFKSDIEKFLEGQDIEEIQEEENDE